MRGKSIILGLMAVALLISCSGKKEKPPLPEVKRVEKAFDLTEKIKEAYENHNLEVFKNLTTKKGYVTLIGSVREFKTARLEFSPRMVDIKNDHMILYMDWKGRWQYDGEEVKKSGFVAFVLRGDPPKLDDILRDNPFSNP